MLKKIISAADMRVLRKTNVTKVYDKSIIGVHDIVSMGTGSDTRIYASTCSSGLPYNSYVIMIDPFSVSDPTYIPQLVEQSSSEITSLATNGTTLYCCEDDHYGDEDKGILSITPNEKLYVNDLLGSWSGITVFKNNIFACERNRGRIHTSEHDEDDQLSRVLDQPLVKLGHYKDKWEWIGVAVCGNRLYAAASNMDLCVYNEIFHVFQYICNIREQSFFGSYKKLKGINDRLYFIDSLWQLWEYDPFNPKSLKQVCKEMHGISSICQVDNRIYLSQIHGGIYEYTPDTLTQ